MVLGNVSQYLNMKVPETSPILLADVPLRRTSCAIREDATDAMYHYNIVTIESKDALSNLINITSKAQPNSVHEKMATSDPFFPRHLRLVEPSSYNWQELDEWVKLLIDLPDRFRSTLAFQI